MGDGRYFAWWEPPRLANNGSLPAVNLTAGLLEVEGSGGGSGSLSATA